MDTAPHACERKAKIARSEVSYVRNLNAMFHAVMAIASAKNKKAGRRPASAVNDDFVKPSGLVPIKREWHAKRNGACPCGTGKKFKKCCRSQVVS